MGIDTTKTVTHITSNERSTFEKSPITMEEATAYVVAMLQKNGELELGVSEVTHKYFFAHWSDKEQTTFVRVSNLDVTIVSNIRNIAEGLRISLSEKRLPTPYEIQLTDPLGRISPIHFSVQNKV